MAPGTEIAIRAAGMALAGLSATFAVYMLAFGDGQTRVYGMEHLAIFAQPRLAGSAAKAPPAALDLAATGSLATSAGLRARKPRPPEIVAARADRAWLRIDDAISIVVPGDVVDGIGRIDAIVERDGGWALLDDKGATLLSSVRSAGAGLFGRRMIFK